MGPARTFNLESPLWPFLVVLALQLAAFGSQIPDYHPLGDDIALIVHATGHVSPPSPLEWLTKGYADYFTVYQEWTSPFSNFLRPLADLAYYLDYLLFQDYWGLYLLLGYIVNALGAAIVFVVARMFLQCTRTTSYLVTLVFFLTVVPAKAAFYPSFAFDPLAAVLAGFAFLAMAQARIVTATLLVTTAMFVK